MIATVRQARREDLNEIIRVEECWPETERAPVEKFISRLERFPEGFFLAEVDGAICGTMTSCLINYGPENVRHMTSWEEVTNNGYFAEPGAIENPNTIYIASGVVEKPYRGKGVFEALVQAEVDLAKKLGMSYVVAGAVIPGYDRYCRKHGEILAADYVFLKKGQRFVDPFMDIYRNLDFYVPDVRHVVENYYADEASRHFAALVVNKLK